MCVLTLYLSTSYTLLCLKCLQKNIKMDMGKQVCHIQDIVHQLFANLPTYIDTKCCPCIKAFSFSIGLQCLYHSSFPTVNVSSAS